MPSSATMEQVFTFSKEPTMLHEFFEFSASRFPDITAIEWHTDKNNSRIKQKLSYNQLNRTANDLSKSISQYINNESVVAIFMERANEMVYTAQLAALKAGGAFTCIDRTFPDKRISFILQDASPSVIITDSKSHKRLQTCLKNKDIPIIIYESWLVDKIAYYEDRKVKIINGDQLAYIIYTSGTTGQPKGVLIEHKNISNLILSNKSYFPGITAGYRIGQSSSLAYDSSIEEIYLAFANGGTLVVIDDDTIRMGPDLGNWLIQEQINVLSPPPTLLRSMGPDASKLLVDLKILYVGGEALPLDIVECWAKGRKLVNGYGPTECSVTVTRGIVYPGRPITIGNVVSGNKAWILDSNLNPVRPDEEGELCISGLSVARGYLNRPDLTSQKFVQHSVCGRIYRTGDLVRRAKNGELLYLGRIDSQVKIRGYRVELSSIESHLMDEDGILEAACVVVKSRGNQKLISYVKLKHVDVVLNVSEIKSSLSRRIPQYMVPSEYLVLDVFPTLASGKLDRRALESLFQNDIDMHSSNTSKPFLQCEEALSPAEEYIAKVIRKHLDMNNNPSKISDFFELGGNSLTAAMVVSDLRKNPLTSVLAVRDIYNCRNIQALARRCSGFSEEKKVQPVSTKHKECSICLLFLQILWLSASFISSASFVAFVVFGYWWPQDTELEFHLLIVIPTFFTLLSPIFFPLSITMAVLAKWILIGKYRPGIHPVWGTFYFRHWLTQSLVQMIPWGTISGTNFQIMALRALGADIGENVYIHTGAMLINGGWDLLKIGSNVTIGRDAIVSPVDFESHQMNLGHIVIGDDVTIETRASVCPNTNVGEGSFITNSTLVTSGSRVAPYTRLEGVPGKMSGPVPLVPKYEKNEYVMTPNQYAMVYITAQMVVSSLTSPLFLTYFIDSYMKERYADQEYIILIRCSFLVFGVLISLAMQAILLRIMGRIKEGIYHRRAMTFMFACLKDRVVTSAGTYVSGTLFWPLWLRCAGMRIGKNCEISTIMEVIPELVEIGEETFFADGIYLGGAKIQGNYAVMERTVLSKNTFLGNHVIIPPGSKLPSDILIGVCTVADPDKIYSGSSWFGNPIFELPRREIIKFDRSLTHNPSMIRYIVRLFWELLRLTLPIPPTIALFVWYFKLRAWRQIYDDTIFLALLAPSFSLGILMSFVLAIIVLKWILVGRMRAGQHALWSSWCSRWDFLYVAWSFWARPVLSIFNGTLIINAILRLFGVNIGRNVFLGANFAQVTDPDLLYFEDNTTVCCDFQAHSFEDRVLKKAPLHIRKKASVKIGTVLMYGADIGTETVVGEHSVVMKNERIPEKSYFIGCPTR